MQEQALPAKHRPRIVFVGFILSLLLPPLGVIISAVALYRAVKNSLRGKWLALSGVIIGVILTIPIIFFLWLFVVLGGLKWNEAQKDAQPFASQIDKLGGKKICDNGDSGYGIDNTQPWYQVYYTVPDNANLTASIKNIAHSQGYNLENNTDFINQLKGLPDKNGVINEPYGGEQFNSNSDYLIGQNGDKTLKLTVNRQTVVALYCVSNYGRTQQAGNNTAILDIYLSLPDRNQ